MFIEYPYNPYLHDPNKNDRNAVSDSHCNRSKRKVCLLSAGLVTISERIVTKLTYYSKISPGHIESFLVSDGWRLAAFPFASDQFIPQFIPRPAPRIYASIDKISNFHLETLISDFICDYGKRDI